MPGRGFDRGLGAGRSAELAAGIVGVKIYGAFAQADDLRDLGRSLAARDPGENLDLAVVQTDRLRPQSGTRDPVEPRRDDRCQHVEVDRLGDIIVGAELAALELVVRSVSAVRNTNGIFAKRGASAVSLSSNSKPDSTGMLISDSTRSGMALRMAARPSRPS